MGLYDTMKNAKIGEEAKMAEAANLARMDGVEKGRIAENRDIANEARLNEAMIRKQQMQDAQVKKAFRFGQLAPESQMAEDLRNQANGYPSDTIQEQADDQNAVVPVNQAGQLNEDPNVRAANIMAMLGDMQKKNASPKQINDAINGFKQSENNSTLNALQELQNEMNPEPNPTQGIQPSPTRVPTPVYPSSGATDLSRGIMNNIAQAEMQKQQQIAQQQALAAQQTQGQ